ncbi:MAG TPA: hypothetical protein ENH02_06970, partial [Bacteroidetes bacterium]|nr:hypothetical protein [Bacteroidota bacterium]
MKKQILHLSVFILGFFMIFQVVQAQQGQNPFSVKQKSSTVKTVIKPAPLNAKYLFANSQGQRTLLPSSGYNYHSILYQNPLLSNSSQYA